jgi:transposase
LIRCNCVGWYRHWKDSEIVFGLGPATRIYVALGATDMRKGFDGIYGIVRDWLALERAAGICFCFANARRTGYGIKGWIRL